MRTAAQRLLPPVPRFRSESCPTLPPATQHSILLKKSSDSSRSTTFTISMSRIASQPPSFLLLHHCGHPSTISVLSGTSPTGSPPPLACLSPASRPSTCKGPWVSTSESAKLSMVSRHATCSSPTTKAMLLTLTTSVRSFPPEDERNSDYTCTAGPKKEVVLMGTKAFALFPCIDSGQDRQPE